MTTTKFSLSPRLRLSGPAALVEAVPFLLGFRPSNSLVALALRPVPEGSPRVVATARADLDDSAVAALAGFAVRAAEIGADRAVVLVVGPALPPDAPVDLAWGDDAGQARLRVAGAVGAMLGVHGVSPVDLLVVAERLGDRGERGWQWRSAWCEDPNCCPPNGRFVADDGVVSARAVGLGMTALPDRAGIVAELVPDAERAAQVATAIDDLRRWWFVDDDERLAQVASIQAALDSGPAAHKVDPAQAARYITALRDVHVRDAVAVTQRRRRPREQRAAALRAAQRFWLGLTRVAPAGWVAPPATLLAMTAYRLGDGARANAALDRAFADDPDYPLAGLIAQALVLAVPPVELEAIWRRSARLRAP